MNFFRMNSDHLRVNVEYSSIDMEVTPKVKVASVYGSHIKFYESIFKNKIYRVKTMYLTKVVVILKCNIQLFLNEYPRYHFFF